MSNAFMRLEEQLAAAQAEVARLHESASALREMDSQCDAYATQAVVLTRERDEARASLHADAAEIAALRRVLAQLSDVTVCFNGCDPSDMTCASNAAKAALSAPSAAEPLLADIRTAVEALEAAAWTQRGDTARITLADIDQLARAAITSLRRWVP